MKARLGISLIYFVYLFITVTWSNFVRQRKLKQHNDKHHISFLFKFQAMVIYPV